MKANVPALALILVWLGAASSSAQTRLELPERGKVEFSLLAGFGASIHVNRGRTEEQLLMLQPQGGYRLGAHFEWLVEGHLAKYFRPDGFAAGLVPLGARYFFGTGSVAPYFQLGAGFCWTDLQVEEIDRRFNFVLQGSFGVRGTPRRGRAWMLEARYLHYSNAGTSKPNLGFNALVLLVGWRFR